MDLQTPPENTLLSVSAALHKLLASFAPLEGEVIALQQAAGRVLNTDLTSPVDLPLFTYSAMDGFALRAADTSGATRSAALSLKVVADIPAGMNSPVIVQPGECARIMTGAALPAGCDAVIPVEDTDFNYRQPGLPAPVIVRLHATVEVGEHVRPRGQDVRRGEIVLRAGTTLRAQEIGLLAMMGIPQVNLCAIPKVAIFSTGDELLPVQAQLSDGKIHDANSYTLTALAAACRAHTINLGIIPDRSEDVKQALDHALESGAHVIVSSAGVSVGAYDFVRSVVAEHGRIDFWQVNMRPGKPFAFGSYQGVPFFGLPGNPVSAYVGFQMFVRPALMRLAGRVNWQPLHVPVTLTEQVDSDGRQSYLRAVVSTHPAGFSARLTGHQGSGNLRSLVQANALLVVPSGVKSLPAGAGLQAILLDADDETIRESAS